MIAAIRERLPWNLILAYLACSALCSAMVLYRYATTGQTVYAWLVVPNLVLAWMPFGFGLAIRLSWSAGWRNPAVYGALGLLWLLFFPNAPYLITDLIHLLYVQSEISIYFDIALVFMAAATGLGLGFHSLELQQDLVEHSQGRMAGWLFVGAVSVLSAVGIYLGRVERWNSWDMLRSPLSILSDLITAALGGELLPILSSYSLITIALYLAFRARRTI